MKNVRRLILYLSSFIGVWVLVSFAGAMVDSANAAFWSDSLMWSLLSALIVMPALVLINDAATQSASRHATSNANAGASQGQDQRASNEQEPFVQRDSDEARTLWPEPQQTPEKPSRAQGSSRTSDHVRA